MKVRILTTLLLFTIIGRFSQCRPTNNTQEDLTSNKNKSDNRLSVCTENTFQCNNKVCILKQLRCDGKKDCPDGSDEIDCSIYTIACGKNKFLCEYNNMCIPRMWICDGDEDCPDGSDEMNCNLSTTAMVHVNVETSTGSTWMFKCNNNKSIPYWWKCNGFDDCNDNTDEIDCGYLSTSSTARSTLTSTTFTTFTTPIATTPISQNTCNHEMECLKSTNCSIEEFKCRTNESCISLDKVCNGHIDCPDGSDEVACKTSCPIGYFSCDGSVCQPVAVLCDRRRDCRDGFDENNCNYIKRV
ncbi:hypothetical protein ILUMI_19400 [Ignelater luminosus]|uniref:Uncharacterized protein n=1 Tax=Ignelater luminosus TaxID=2038154 RepID=A0A8K0G5M2_IGNLU|nr:hypothetical protein ILUMI_19400 [Ignelater luminosus]